MKKKNSIFVCLLLSFLIVSGLIPLGISATAFSSESTEESSASVAPESSLTSETDAASDTRPAPETQKAAEIAKAPERSASPAKPVHLKIKVILNTSMHVVMNSSDSFKFSVNGVEYEVKNPAQSADGPIEFEAEFNNVMIPDGQSEQDVAVSMLSLPQGADMFFSIISQKYDAASHTLNVDLGRDLYIKVSDLKDGSTYFSFAENHNVPGFELELYDEGGKLLQKSLSASTYFGVMPEFQGLRPGTYKVKVSKTPAGYENYDVDRLYTLEIAKNGFPKLEIYQSDGQFHLAKANGAEDGTYPTDPMLNGIKSPLLLVLPKINMAKKFITKEGKDVKKLTVGKNDIVEFRVEKKISPDHNAVAHFGKYINIGCFYDQSFADTLDKNLEFVTGTLSLTLDGNPTDDFEASYDAASHSVLVNDKSHPTLLEFDFSNPIKLGDEKTLELRFKVKVLKAEEKITNTVDQDTTELIPFKISGEKIWEDFDNSFHTRPDHITVKLLKNGEEYRETEVSPDSEGKWEYTFTDLPLTENGAQVKYSVAESSVKDYKFETDGFNLINRYAPSDINIKVRKIWDDKNNSRGIRPNNITVMLFAGSTDTGKRVTLSASGGWSAEFTGLPQLNDEGKKIVYTVKESGNVKGYISKVSGSQEQGFTLTNTLIPEKPTPQTGEAESAGGIFGMILLLTGIMLFAVKIFKEREKTT